MPRSTRSGKVIWAQADVSKGNCTCGGMKPTDLALCFQPPTAVMVSPVSLLPLHNVTFCYWCWNNNAVGSGIGMWRRKGWRGGGGGMAVCGGGEGVFNIDKLQTELHTFPCPLEMKWVSQSLCLLIISCKAWCERCPLGSFWVLVKLLNIQWFLGTYIWHPECFGFQCLIVDNIW